MASDLDQYGQPLRRFPAHWSAAALAIGGAAAVQWAWPVIVRRPSFDSWWPFDAALIVAATGYLLALAEVHVRTASWRPNELVPRLWLLGRVFAGNLVVAVYLLVIFVQGPQTSTLRAGLSILPPVLLAVCAASAAVTVLSLRDGWRRIGDDVPPPGAPHGAAKVEIVHSVFVIGLLLALVALESVEPQVKPWETETVQSAAAGKSQGWMRRLLVENSGLY